MTREQFEQICFAVNHFDGLCCKVIPGRTFMTAEARGVIVEKWAYELIARIYWSQVEETVDLGNGLKLKRSGSPFSRSTEELGAEDKVWMQFNRSGDIMEFQGRCALALRVLNAGDMYKRIPFSEWTMPDTAITADGLHSGEEKK